MRRWLAHVFAGQPLAEGPRLDEPDHVVGVQLVLADPGGQDVPLHALAAVDGDPVLRVLVLAGLQVGEHLLRQLRQEAPVQQVVLRAPRTAPSLRVLSRALACPARTRGACAGAGGLPGALAASEARPGQLTLSGAGCKALLFSLVSVLSANAYAGTQPSPCLCSYLAWPDAGSARLTLDRQHAPSRDRRPAALARLLDEDLAQAALPERVVLQVEAVEAVEGVLVRVHVQRVHIQVVPGRVSALALISRLHSAAYVDIGAIAVERRTLKI